MKMSQNRYLRDKETSKAKPDRATVEDLDNKYHRLVEEDTKEIHDPKPIVDIDEDLDKRRMLIKNSNCLGSNLKRHFELTGNQQFVYYENIGDTKPKKKLDLEKCKWEIETKRDLNKKELKTWKDKDESKVYRLKISVPKK
jgi:hypothetical protein